MKKKLVISIVSIMSFILLLSGIVLLNNKDIKSTSIEKEVKSDNQEDTTWQEKFIYKLDKKNKYLAIIQYIGKNMDIVIPAKAVIDGVEYTTMPVGARVDPLIPRGAASVIFEDGVKFGTKIPIIGSVGKLKFGKMDTELLDTLYFGYFNMNSSQSISELDLSDFDNRSMEKIGGRNSDVTYDVTKSVTLGKNVVLKKTYMTATKYLFFIQKNKNKYSSYWLKEGTNEVYSANDLSEIYDGATMSGKYVSYTEGLISYNLNGIEGYIPATKVDDTATVSSMPYQRYGYEFTGWNTKSDGTGDSYAAGATLSTSEPITLYAQWNKVNNEELETYDLNIKLHFNDADDEYFDENFIIQNFEMRVKTDNIPYTQNIEGAGSASNGVYKFEYSKREKPDGITISIPKNATYEIEPVVEVGPYGYDIEKLSGKMTEDKNVDLEAKIFRYDMKNYILVSNPYDLDGKTEYDISFLIGYGNNQKKDLVLNYDGGHSGTVTLSGMRQTQFTVSDGDIITIHDVPVGVGTVYNNGSLKAIHSSNPNFNPSGSYGLLYYDYSGNLGEGLPFNYLIGLQIERYRKFGIIKTGNPVGINGDKYKFTINAKSSSGEYFTGKVPYYDGVTGDKIGFIEFDESGNGEVEVDFSSPIVIGKSNYASSVDYLCEPHDSISEKYRITITEVQDLNKLEKISPQNPISGITPFYNRRKQCAINFNKNLVLKSNEISYLNLKNYVDDEKMITIETDAINQYLENASSDDEKLKLVNELFNEKELDSLNNVDLVNYLRENIKKVNKEKLYKIYDNYISSNLEQLDLGLKYKFKLVLKDNATLTNNGFRATIDSKSISFNNNTENLLYDEEENKYTYTFELKPSVYVDDKNISNNNVVFNNLWCGMEYEIEELDADKYEVEENNTKGILKHDGKSAYSVPVVNEASINNKLKLGSLTLNKKIKDDITKDEEFEFEISLDLDENDSTEYKYTGSKEGYIEFKDGKASITLKGGESIKIEDLPLGVEYKVVEKTKGYKVTKENDKGTIDKETIVTFTNSKKVKKASEIVNTLDGVGKYIIVAIVSIIGIVTTILLRKHSLER